MENKGSIGSKICTIIFIILVAYALSFIYNIYKENYFGDFIRAEYQLGLSEFKRDRKVKNGSHDSYRIVSNDYNDAMYSKVIEVTPNTPYRISCMIKTKDVVTQKAISNAGAGICIADTTEYSDTITGTTDWTKVEFMFNSKARTEVEIGFRLGSNSDNCKGTAWFSDFKLEVGSRSQDSNWKMVCFIFDSIDVMIEKNGKPYRMNEVMTSSDIRDIKDSIERTKNSFKSLSNYKMTMDYEIIEISEPIKSISRNNDNGYYVSPSDVYSIIKDYIREGEYDYIYAAVKFGSVIEENLNDQNNWIGLGGMDLKDIGFSNIRLPNDAKSYIYKYDPIANLFPEEVFIHEFLHTAERISKDNGYDYPLLHNYEQYGYKVESKYGLKNWYRDYMQCNITTTHGIKVGIDSNVYTIKPVHKSAFNYSMEVDFDDDPDNLIEEVRTILKVIFNGSKNISRGEASKA